MATKQERFALFRAQTQQYLDQQDAVRVKEVLATFLKEKVLEDMVSGLLSILDTEEKQKMLPTIQSLIPSKYHDAFDALIASRTQHVLSPDHPLAGLSDEEVARRILDDPSLAEAELCEGGGDDDDDDDDDHDGSAPTEANDRYRLRRTASEVVDEECPVDLGQEEGETNLFDLVITMAEADLKLESTVDDDEPAEPKRRMSANDIRRQQMKQSIKMKQRGFRSGSFVVHPSHSESPTLPDEVRRVSVSRSIALPDYLCLANTRAEASAFLSMAGKKPGLFLIREKDMRPGGSLKRKPGQRLPRKAWALSFVNEQGELHNMLIEHPSTGAPLRIGSQDVPDCQTVHDVLLKLVRSKQYPFKDTPFQCRRWYHGAIAREEAEARLMSTPVDGRFLVRKSTREKDIYIVSLLFNGKCFHNKIAYAEGSWRASAAPLVNHDALADLIEYHAEAANGMQTSLSKPCSRPTPWTLEEVQHTEA